MSGPAGTPSIEDMIRYPGRVANFVNSLVQLGHGERLARAIEGVVQNAEKIDSHLLSKVGNVAFQVQKYEEAGRCFLVLAVREIDQAANYFNASITFALSGKYEDGLSTIRRACELDPANKKYQLELASLLKLTRNTRDSIEIYERELVDSNVEARHLSNFAAALLDDGQFERAATIGRKARDLEPDHFGVNLNLGLSFFELREYRSAKIYLEKAHALNPRSPNPYQALFPFIHDEQGRDAARAFLEEGIQACGRPENLRVFHGIMQALDGREMMFDFPDWARFHLEGIDFLKTQNPDIVVRMLDGNVFRQAAPLVPQTGLCLEFGVRWGTSTKFLRDLLGRTIIGFDSFEGLPGKWLQHDVGAYSTGKRIPKLGDGIELVAGWYNETIPDFAKKTTDKIAFMNVDCDMYVSTKEIFTHLGERLVPGCVIVFDEYVGNPKWQEDEHKAFREYVDDKQINHRYEAFSPYSKQCVVTVGG